MPPQGMPHPQRSRIRGVHHAGCPARSTAPGRRRSNPGRYVVHRLNRTEYGNAIRDLLALDVDVTELLPSDGGDFGFDNIAASLSTSPLLLERYLTAAQRISAHGGRRSERGARDDRIFDQPSSSPQKQHVDGLPLGTRGGTVVRHVFPADGEYKLSGRLVRASRGRLRRRRGQRHAARRSSSRSTARKCIPRQVGGPEDHEVQAKRHRTRRARSIDARMTGTCHRDRRSARRRLHVAREAVPAQDVWQPSLRDSQEVHLVGGLPRLRP